MRITILSILVNLCLLLQAQIYNYPIPISATTTHVTEKNGKGIFVAQKIKGKISGSGLYQGKDESIYIGDFKDKVFNGTGMFIASLRRIYPIAPMQLSTLVDSKMELRTEMVFAIIQLARPSILVNF